MRGFFHVDCSRKENRKRFPLRIIHSTECLTHAIQAYFVCKTPISYWKLPYTICPRPKQRNLPVF